MPPPVNHEHEFTATLTDLRARISSLESQVGKLFGKADSTLEQLSAIREHLNLTHTPDTCPKPMLLQRDLDNLSASMQQRMDATGLEIAALRALVNQYEQLRWMGTGMAKLFFVIFGSAGILNVVYLLYRMAQDLGGH
jgi:hypothetical protein